MGVIINAPGITPDHAVRYFFDLGGLSSTGFGLVWVGCCLQLTNFAKKEGRNIAL